MKTHWHGESSSSSHSPAICLGYHFGWDFCVCDHHLVQPLRSLWMVHAGCVFVAGIHPSRTWIFEVRAMEYMCAQTRPRFILSSRGMESEPMLTPREESPLPETISSEEDRTHNAASSRTTSPTPLNLQHCIKQGNEPNTLPTSYCSPHMVSGGSQLVGSFSVSHVTDRWMPATGNTPSMYQGLKSECNYLYGH